MGIKTGRTGEADLHPTPGEETGARIASHTQPDPATPGVEEARYGRPRSDPAAPGLEVAGHPATPIKPTGLDEAPRSPIRSPAPEVVKGLVKDVGGHCLASTPTGPTLAGPDIRAAEATGSDSDEAPLQGPKRHGKKKKKHIMQERNDRNDAFRQMVKVGSYVEVHLPATGQDPGSCVEVQDTDDWWDAQVLKVCLDDGRDGWMEVLL